MIFNPANYRIDSTVMTFATFIYLVKKRLIVLNSL